MNESLFSGVTPAPADPILSITEKFRADARACKVNLGVGAYLTEEGKTPVLEVVKEAELELARACIAHTYIPISGLPGYGELVQKMVFGTDSEIVVSGRAATVQTLGGTGALKVGCDLMHSVCGVCVGAASRPTWGNHNAIMALAGYSVQGYRYFDAANNCVNFDGMLADIEALPEHSLVILHSCCHNPTGYDLTSAQWDRVIGVCRSRNHIPFLDMAYQGFREGLEEDAAAIRQFAASGLEFLVATSYSKSFNLYGERIGALTVVTRSAEQAQIVMSQLKSVIRANYSNPPEHGARIVASVLADPVRYARWEAELTEMRERIRSMRVALVDELVRIGAKRDFSFITRQNGMFSFTGLNPEQIDRLAVEFGIYAVRNGRICICGLNNRNVEYVAQAINQVL